MRFLRGLCRVLFALTFILSGILKLLDPVGTGLIVHEYLSFMHLDFLDSGAIVLGIALATLDTAIANTALPAIAVDLNASPAASVWIINAYQLAAVATLLPFCCNQAISSAYPCSQAFMLLGILSRSMKPLSLKPRMGVVRSSLLTMTKPPSLPTLNT